MRTQAELLLHGLEVLVGDQYPQMSATSRQSHVAGMLAEIAEILAGTDSQERNDMLAKVQYWKSLANPNQ